MAVPARRPPDRPAAWTATRGGPGGGRGRQAADGRQEPGGETQESDGESPAVVSLLAGRLDKLGFGATLVDLAARGWFRVHAPAGPGEAGGPGPALCVVPGEAPGGALAPFERRVAAAHRPYGLAWAAGLWFGGFVLAAGWGQQAAQRGRAGGPGAVAFGRGRGTR